jgi:2-iminobutanoate/2-iminopropanoate deaminase
MKEKLIYKKIAPAIGPYSQAIKYGDLIYTSGQIAMDSHGTVQGPDIEIQTKKVLQNLSSLLEDHDSSLENAVKVTVYLTDMNNFAKMNGVYNEFFGTSLPARSTVEVSRLPKDVLVEMDVIAYVNK